MMEKELENYFLEELERHKESLLRVCSVYARDSNQKKDYFQESVLQMWRSLPQFKGNASLKTWMYRITVNVCLGLNKQAHKVRLKGLEFIDEKSIVGKSENIDPRLDHLRRCIAKLEINDKAIVSLYLEEFKYKEIANVTGLSENHIAVKIKRIKQKLLNCINQTL